MEVAISSDPLTKCCWGRRRNISKGSKIRSYKHDTKLWPLIKNSTRYYRTISLQLHSSSFWVWRWRRLLMCLAGNKFPSCVVRRHVLWQPSYSRTR